MEKFDKALKALPMHIRLSFNPTQLEGEHPGPALPPGAGGHPAQDDLLPW